MESGKGLQSIINSFGGSPQSRLQDAFVSFGMATPMQRFVVGSAAGAILVWAVRPNIAFDESGSAKSWVFTGDPAKDQITSAPWWALAVIPGIFMAVFL